MSDWVSDVKPSLPVPVREPIIDMGGFSFSTGGLVHTLTKANQEDHILEVNRP